MSSVNNESETGLSTTSDIPPPERVDPRVLLPKFKNMDSPSKARILLGDEELSRLVVAFEMVGCALDDSVSGGLPKSTDKQWDWLWSHTDVDLDRLAMAAGLTTTAAATKLMQARALKLVYPDGSISKMASQLFRAQVGAEISKLAQEQRKAQANK